MLHAFIVNMSCAVHLMYKQYYSKTTPHDYEDCVLKRCVDFKSTTSLI